ncbi:MAG: OsmC family protein [Natronomonas sp.]
MVDIETRTVNESDYHALSRVGNFELSVDATGEEGPTPNQVLVADYASCFTFACRAGARRELDVDLGRVETDASADLDDSEDLESVRFDIQIEASLEDDQIDELVEIGKDICHVHAAVRDDLLTDIEVTVDAF